MQTEPSTLLDDLVDLFKEKVPALHAILINISTVESDWRNKRKTPAVKAKLMLLVVFHMSRIASKQASTSFGLLFSLLLVSFGAPRVLIEFFCSIALGIAYETVNSFFDEHMKKTADKFRRQIDPLKDCIILFFDNINVTAAVKYQRLRRKVRAHAPPPALLSLVLLHSLSL
jgi:hypothetical protein